MTRATKHTLYSLQTTNVNYIFWHKKMSIFFCIAIVNSLKKLEEKNETLSIAAQNCVQNDTAGSGWWSEMKKVEINTRSDRMAKIDK